MFIKLGYILLIIGSTRKFWNKHLLNYMLVSAMYDYVTHESK